MKFAILFLDLVPEMSYLILYSLIFHALARREDYESTSILPSE